uniref:RING-type E3 ubiquitin transferase n=1 Tax=Xiphophorus couchianus TaxID=32473 RepID=A0A3B5LS87_9TELE
MCPQCESGFIEELLEERRCIELFISFIMLLFFFFFYQNMDQQLSMFPSGFGQFSVSVFDDTFDLGPGLGTEDNQDAENQSERDMSSRQRYGARQSRSRHGSRRQAGRHDGAPTLEGIIQQLVNGIIGPPANIGVGAWGVLHSNPMDYAWGANGLDAIITQLLNQFENSGPPPADSDKIKSLPTVEITDEHVASGLECSVCKEDYSVGENVRQLPCNHMFHNDCIVPWLEQHDTCPVCRTSLTGLNTATNPPELSEMNFTSSPSSSSSSSSSSSTSSSPPSSDSTSNESSTDNS